MNSAPAMKHRVQAIVALGAGAVLTLLILAVLFRNPAMLVLGIVGLALAGGGGWWVVTEQMPRRGIGAVVAVLGLIALAVAVVGVISGTEMRFLVIVGVLALFAVAVGQARLALVRGLHEADGIEAPRPARPVLIANPKSGGGKVERFDIVAKAQQLGVEVIMLNKGDDLEQLARDAVARGADCLGMAGGDGSQALVASVAADSDLPFVCISAGTRNHFALDLGLDRADPSAGLIAFTDAIERRIDHATVADRLFVNNVSMGVYATIVQEEGYRDAKVETSKSLLPELLGKQQQPFDLQFATPDGTAVDGAFLILVSNNPYVLGPKLDVSQRRSLSTGKLGVFAVNARTGAEAAAMMARGSLGLGGRDPHIHQFEADEFVVDSRSGHAFCGIDGEALDLPTPLQFRIHPGRLRIRVPRDSEQRLERRVARNVGIGDLFRVAAGKPMKLGAVEHRQGK